MADFKIFEPTLKLLEGGNYEAKEETKWGVSPGLFKTATGKTVTGEWIKNATWDDLKPAAVWVWNKLQLSKVPSQDCANIVFYLAYNTGHNRVPCLLQSFLAKKYGFKGAIDGIIGSASAGAMVAAVEKSEAEFYDGFLEIAKRYYAGEENLCPDCTHKNCVKYKNGHKYADVWLNFSKYFTAKKKTGDTALETFDGGQLTTFEVTAAKVKNLANPQTPQDWTTIAIVGGVVILVLVVVWKVAQSSMSAKSATTTATTAAQTPPQYISIPSPTK